MKLKHLPAWIFAASALALLAGMAPVNAADPEHVDQTLMPDADAGIVLGGSDPRGASDEFQSGFFSDDTKKMTEYRILMHFDLSTLKKTPVTCAILRICNKNNTGGKNRKFFRVHALYRDFDEKTATWYTNAKEDGWINPGGDFLQTCYGAASMPTKWGGEEEHYYSFDITQLVQGWQNGAIKNHGLIIMTDAESDNYQRFHSREFASNRPMLWISYSGQITSPDPTVMASNGIPAFGPAPDYKPHITTKELNAGTAGAPYAVQLTAKGGERPYKWELIPGTKLPEGFTLSETGALAGTTTAAVTLAFKVKVTTADRKSDVGSLKLVIQAGAGAPIQASPKPNDPSKPAAPATPDPKKPALPNDDG